MAQLLTHIFRTLTASPPVECSDNVEEIFLGTPPPPSLAVLKCAGPERTLWKFQAPRDRRCVGPFMLPFVFALFSDPDPPNFFAPPFVEEFPRYEISIPLPETFFDSPPVL